MVQEDEEYVPSKSEDDLDADVMEVCEVESAEEEPEKILAPKPNRPQRSKNQQPAASNKRSAVSTHLCINISGLATSKCLWR